MSKLATGNPRMTALTLCPGNLLYMSPEALDEAKSYTAKLDIFSFGVIVIQIMTRQFPAPTDRHRIVHTSQNDEDDEEVRVLVPETERRQAHLQLIPNTHSLKPLALQCLKKRESLRPSALQLSESLSEMKQAPQYTESMHQAQNSSEIQHLEQQLRNQRILIETKTREVSELQAHSTQLQRMVEAKGRQLEEKQQTIEETQHTMATKQHVIETKESQLQQTQQQLRDSQQLVVRFQQSLEHNDKTINDLQQTISHHEREIQQLKQQDIVSSIQPQLPVTAEKATAVLSVPQKDISKKMMWRGGKNAPETMVRGAAVVHGNTAYFTPYNSGRVYSYQNILGNEQWYRLPDNPNQNSGLAVVDGLLTSVGGCNSHSVYTNTLLSLTSEGERKKWSEIFPPMHTPRYHIACMTPKQALVVAGGDTGSDLATVEVMDINTKRWTIVCPLPQKLRSLSGIVCGDSLYLAGGTTGSSESKSVFTCSLPNLWQPETLGSRIRQTLTRSNVWKEISSLPVTGSTLALFGGHLLAIGGEYDIENSTSDVYRYDSDTDSWHVISPMKNNRSLCLAVTLPGDKLIVVGGYGDTESVEILEDKEG